MSFEDSQWNTQVFSPCKQKDKAEVGCLTKSSVCINFLCTPLDVENECVIVQQRACATPSILASGSTHANYLSQTACKWVRPVTSRELFSRWITEKVPHVKMYMFEKKYICIFSRKNGMIYLILIHFPCTCPTCLPS